VSRTALNIGRTGNSHGRLTDLGRTGGGEVGAQLSNDVPAKAVFSTAELASMVGMSATFIRTEIQSGEIKAIRLGRGRRHVFRIPYREAVRYMQCLGVL